MAVTPQLDGTYLSVAEWSDLRDNTKALSRGTKKLVPVIEARNPKITPTQADTIVEDLDEAIRNLTAFKNAVQKLTKHP